MRAHKTVAPSSHATWQPQSFSSGGIDCVWGEDRRHVAPSARLFSPAINAVCSVGRARFTAHLARATPPICAGSNCLVLAPGDYRRPATQLVHLPADICCGGVASSCCGGSNVAVTGEARWGRISLLCGPGFDTLDEHAGATEIGIGGGVRAGSLFERADLDFACLGSSRGCADDDCDCEPPGTADAAAGAEAEGLPPMPPMPPACVEYFEFRCAKSSSSLPRYQLRMSSTWSSFLGLYLE